MNRPNYRIEQTRGPLQPAYSRFADAKWDGSYIGGTAGLFGYGDGIQLPRNQFRSNLDVYGNEILPQRLRSPVPWHLLPAMGYRELIQSNNNSLGGAYGVQSHGYGVLTRGWYNTDYEAGGYDSLGYGVEDR